jgi:hypothetical protein
MQLEQGQWGSEPVSSPRCEPHSGLDAVVEAAAASETNISSVRLAQASSASNVAGDTMISAASTPTQSSRAAACPVAVFVPFELDTPASHAADDMTDSGSEAEETEGVVVRDLCAETISSQATQENGPQSYVCGCRPKERVLVAMQNSSREKRSAAGCGHV